jgi:hypothetical protein
LPTIVAGAAVADTGSATHILCDCYAFPIAATELFLDSTGRGSSRRTDHTVASINRNGSGVWMGVENAAALKLNGSAVDKAVRIRPGDRITIEGAGCVFTPISVVATDGA